MSTSIVRFCRLFESSTATYNTWKRSFASSPWTATTEDLFFASNISPELEDDVAYSSHPPLDAFVEPLKRSRTEPSLHPSAGPTPRAQAAPWPPKRSNTVNTSYDSASSEMQVNMVLKARERKIAATLVSALSASVPDNSEAAVLESGKENRAPVSKLVFNPPIVHPLPLYSYRAQTSSPSRVYTQHEDETNDLVQCLSGPVGFDLEWRVIFARGAPMRPAATVQLSDRNMILVIQVSSMRTFPQRLKELLENPEIPKVGVNILNDGNKLFQDYGVRCRSLIELGTLARQADALYAERYFRVTDPSGELEGTKRRKPGAMMNLAAITAMYTGCTLNKGPVRTSNWEARPLSEQQLEYAANDAHCAVTVYHRLLDMATGAKVTLEPSRYTKNVTQGEPRAASSKQASLTVSSRPQSISAPIQRTKSAPVSMVGATASTPSMSAVALKLSKATRSVRLKRVPSANLAEIVSLEFDDVSDSDFDASISVSTPLLSRTPSASASVSSSASITDPVVATTKKSASASVALPVSKSLSRSYPVNTTRVFQPSYLRAFTLWSSTPPTSFSLPALCATLRSPSNPLKQTTVISYIVRAIQEDSSLTYDKLRLESLIKDEDSSWRYYRAWFKTL